MSSPPPLVYETYYHIYNRGNNGENIFKQERNYRHFLKLYGKHIGPVAETFAYCLLPNHFHGLVRIKSKAEIVAQTSQDLRPSQQFSNFFNAYAKSINHAHRRTGSLFEHPFERIPVDSEAYFTQLIIYIHQNPQRHRLIDDFRNWPYSSYSAFFSTQPTRVQRETVLTWFDGPQNTRAQHNGPVNEANIAPLIGDDFD